MSVTEAITLSIAILGACLGILNTWQSLAKDRLKVKVTPKIYFPVRDGFLTISGLQKAILQTDPKWKQLYDNGKMLCIEVVNLSYLPITVSQVGFKTHSQVGRIVIMRPLKVEGSKLPCRLEPRSSVTIYGNEHLTDDEILSIKRAYCETDCARTFVGSSPALRNLIKRLRNAAEQ